jgi:RNA polymerase sigma-70 factor (ECF subfamily)
MAATAQVPLSEAILMAVPAEDELERAVQQHAQVVFRIAYSVLRNHADAEDATQEVFLRALRHRGKLAELHDTRAWLARIAWRVAIDRKRSPREVSVDEAAADGSMILQLRAGGAGAEQIASDRQMLALMEQLIAGLPRELREVTVLATVQELSTRELAHALEIPEGTVRNRLFRARQMLREKLAGVLEGRTGRTT